MDTYRWTDPVTNIACVAVAESSMEVIDANEDFVLDGIAGREILRLAALEAENAALRERVLGRVADGEPLPSADEVYGILTPCPCGDTGRPGHPAGWCVRGQVIYDDAR